MNNNDKSPQNFFNHTLDTKDSKTESRIKSAMKNIMINLPGRDMYTYGNNVKKIFEELKKT